MFVIEDAVPQYPQAPTMDPSLSTGPEDAMLALIRSCLTEIEKDWAKHLGAQRFNTLRETLHDLALRLGKI
jgi:hypothetical protein